MYGYLHRLFPNGTHLTFERVNEEDKRSIVETLQIPYDMPLGNITVWAEVWDADGAYLKTQNITVGSFEQPALDRRNILRQYNRRHRRKPNCKGEHLRLRRTNKISVYSPKSR